MKAAASAVLLSEGEIQRRVAEMGDEISRDYKDRKLTAVAILKGSFVFLADLIRHIDPSIPVTVEFMAVSSYGDATRSSGRLNVEWDVASPLEGKDVLIVEDIVDSGLTVAAVKDLLAARKPRSLGIATLLDKAVTRSHSLTLDYVGFKIPDVFVVGYGLDFAQHYRNLKEIRILNAR